MTDLETLFDPLVAAERPHTPTPAELRARSARRRRRRAASTTAAALVLAVAVASVVALTPGHKRTLRVGNTSTTLAPHTRAATVTAIGWQATVAGGWHVQKVAEWCNQPGEPGLVLSPDPKALSAAEHTAGCFQTKAPQGLTAISIVAVQPAQPVNVSVPSTPLPISLADMPRDPTQPSVYEIEVLDHGQDFLLRVNLAPEAPAAVRAALDATLHSLHRVPGLPPEPPVLGRDASHLSIAVEGLAVDATGTIYAVASNRVFAIAGGRVTRVIGTGAQGFAGDGGPAADAELDAPLGVAVDDAGNVYVADSGNNRIRKITPDGTIDTFAGTGAFTPDPDGKPAERTAVAPADILWDHATQSLYVAEDTRVVRIGTDGIVHTVAGTGKQEIGVGVSPGGLATDTPVCSPDGIAISTDRSLWISDFCDKTIARVAPDGRIRPAPGNAFRLAAAPDGSVSAYYGRDGGIERVTPTTHTGLVQLDIRAPVSSCIHYTGNGDDDAALTWHGDTLYFANPSMGRVCALAPDGAISTVVGG